MPPRGIVLSAAKPCAVEDKCRQRSELIVKYGSGRLVDSVTQQTIEGNDITGDYTYIVGLAPEIVDTFRSLHHGRHTFESGDISSAATLRGRIVRDLLIHADDNGFRAMGDFFRVVSAASPEWRDGFLAAANSGLAGLVEYISSSADVAGDAPRVLGVEAALEQGWLQKFCDPTGILDYIHEKLCSYVTLWNKQRNEYMAAWTAVIQSSGWGKSRAICELYTKGVYVIYVSLMPFERNGIPGRTPAADLLASTGDPRRFAVWMMGLVMVLVRCQRDQGMTPEQWNKFQHDPDGKDRIMQELMKVMPVLNKEIEALPLPWNDVNLEAWVRRRWSELGLTWGNGLRYLLCLDEAGSLFQSNQASFFAARLALSFVPRESGLFCVAVDTSAKLESFFPAARRGDPSLKATLPGVKRFSPLWLVGSIRRDWEKLLDAMKSSSDITTPSEEVARELFRWGRPLWSAALSNNATVEDVIEYAVLKVQGGGLLGDVSSLTEPMAVALVGIAAGLAVAAWSGLAKDLVASHMRTATFVSEGCDWIVTADAVEPILGEAAARILHKPGILDVVLDVTERVCKQGLVIEGSRGELMGRLFIVLAMHQCCRDSLSARWTLSGTYSHPVKLKDFLCLLGAENTQREGLLCFNRFIFFNRSQITRSQLLLCFICCHAIIPKKNQDLLLPVLMPGPDGKYELRPDRMRAIPVQIKNLQKPRGSTGELDIRAHELAQELSAFQKKVALMEGKQDQATMHMNVKQVQAGIAGRQRILKKPRLSKDAASEEKQKAADDSEEKDVEPRRGLGIYMYVRGEEKQPPVRMDHNVLVIHINDGAKWRFLQGKQLAKLKRLRKAFFRLEDCYGNDEKMLGRAKDIAYNYVKPKAIEKLKVNDINWQGTQPARR